MASRPASASVTAMRKLSPAVRLTTSSAFSARTASGAMFAVRATSSTRPAMRRARSSAGKAAVPRTRNSVSPSRTTGAVTRAISASGPAPLVAGGAEGSWAAAGAADSQAAPSTKAKARPIGGRRGSRSIME